MSRRLTALGAVATIFASALVLATASPAQATAADDCINYLKSIQRQTTSRDVICLETDALADHGSEQYAFDQCLSSMHLTRLEWDYAGPACLLAAELN